MSRYPSGYVMPWYNGFSPEARRAITAIQNAALGAGTLTRPTTCCICGFSDPARPKGRGYIYCHTEDYRQPLVIYPTCKKHHADLHARFADPARWERVLWDHGRPGEWFTLLSMDPASQWRPFDETYKDGLPLPTSDIRRDLFSYSGPSPR